MPPHQDHLPPLLRGLGFLLILLTSLVVGVSEHRQDAQVRARLAQAHARVEAEAAAALAGGRIDALTREVRLLRLQLQEDDLADKVFENPWFQLLGSLGTALLAVSFFIEARAKRPRRRAPPGAGAA